MLQVLVLLITRFFDFLGLTIKALAFVACVYFGNLTVIELSGKNTNAEIDVSVDLIPPSTSNFGLPWLVTAIAIFWAVSERQLRKTKTRQMSEQQTKTETLLDAKRESSGLAKNGNTHPEDENL